MAKKEQFAVRLPPAALKMVDKLIGSVYGTNRSDVARGLIVDQLKQLVERLAEMGVSETEATIKNKLARGKFSAAFMVQCLEAIGVDTLRL